MMPSLMRLILAMRPLQSEKAASNDTAKPQMSVLEDIQLRCVFGGDGSQDSPKGSW